MQAPKNGVMYVIEAATGKVIGAQLFVPSINWATGFDKKNNWAPILNPDANFGKTGKGLFVVPFRAHVWSSQSYNPNTGLFYVGIRYATYGMVAEAGAKMGNQLLSINVAKRPEYAPPKLEGQGRWLTGLGSGEAEGSLAREGRPAGAGTMTTAGNLVFQGSGRNFIAYRADNGEKVWSAETGSPSRQAPSPTRSTARSTSRRWPGARARPLPIACWSTSWAAPRCCRLLRRRRPRRCSIRRRISAARRSSRAASRSTRRTAPSATRAARHGRVTRTCAPRR